jgi:GntR family transcriptional regulator
MPPPALLIVNQDLPDPVHVQVSDQVQALIERGELRPGMRLPPVRQLARDLDIAPNTVVRAYATLREAGLIVSDGWRGTKIAAVKRASVSARDAALRELVSRAIESLRYRGYSTEQIADVFVMSAGELRRQ